MSETTQKAAQLLDMLPVQDQNLIFELIKKLVLAWDPDFTKATPDEEEAIRIGKEQIARGEVVRHEDMEWD